MKKQTFVPRRLLSFLFIFILSLASGSLGTAQTWVGGSSNVWDNVSNWDTVSYPNSPSASATFDSSAVTNLVLTNSVTVGAVTFTGSAPSYSLDTSSFIFSIQGAGILNSSGVSQTLISGNGSNISFLNSADAGDTSVTINGGNVYFLNNSAAGSASIGNGGYLEFNDDSSATNAEILNSQTVNFKGNATAANASIQNDSVMSFGVTSTAGNSTIENDGYLTVQSYGSLGAATIINNSTLSFIDNSTAGSAAVSNGSGVGFYDSSTAGSATILNDGGIISFSNSAQGGTARFILTNGGQIISDDASHGGSALVLGSIEGSGSVYMGQGGLFVGSNSLSTTFTGVIDDGTKTSSLSKIGTGTLTLTGTNTYDGGTSILVGTLAVDSSGQLGTGKVVNGANLIYFNNADTQGLSIINSGNLDFHNNATANSSVINNSGVAVFHESSTADNSHITGIGSILFGDTSTAANSVLIVSFGGSVSFADNSLGGNAQVNANNGGFLDISVHSGAITLGSVNGSGNVTLGSNNLTEGVNDMSTTVSGVISGTGGSLTKLGLGTLTLTGTNTYTGGTDVEGGTLQINSDSSLGGSAGTLTVNGITLRTLGSVVSTRDILINSGGGLFWDSSTFDSSLSGTLSGTGVLTKNGSGALTLLGNNSYSGGTALNSGALMIGNSGALGSGSISFNGGTLAVTGGPLTINVGGDYFQQAAGTLSLGVSAVGTEDMLAVGGVAQLNGTLGMTAYNSFVPQIGDAVTLITANTGVSGTFSQVLNPAGTRWYPIYHYYDVVVLALQPSFTAVALTANQKSVGTWLDDNFLDPGFMNLVLTAGVQSGSSLPAIYDAIAPDELTQLFQIGHATAQNHSLLVDQRMAAIRNAKEGRAAGYVSRDGNPLFAAAEISLDQVRDMPNKPDSPDKWGVFVNGNGSMGTIASDGNAPGFSIATSGMTAGVDYRINKMFSAGLLLGYSQAGKTTEALEITGGQAGLYGGMKQDGFHAEVLGEMGINSYKIHRAAYGALATGTAGGQQLSGWLGLGYDFQMGKINLGPYASGLYSNVSLDSFTEQGSLAPLVYPAQSQSSLQSEAGVKAGWEMKAGSWTIVPNVGVGWEHFFEGTLDHLTAALASGKSFKVDGPLTGQEAIAVDAGVNVQIGRGLSVLVNYQGKFGRTNFDSQSFSGGVNVGF